VKLRFCLHSDPRNQGAEQTSRALRGLTMAFQRKKPTAVGQGDRLNADDAKATSQSG
jgi:hypothetical protein